MTESISIINHKGKKIIYCDLSGKKEEEILNIMKESTSLQIKERIHHLIFNVRDTVTTKKIQDKSKQWIIEAESKIGKTYSAIIGLRLAQQIIANIIKHDQYFTSNIEDAKEWLGEK